MALILSTGEYLSVEYAEPSINPTKVIYRLHQDASARSRYKAGTMGAFETTQQKHADVTVDVSAFPDSEKSLNDNLITAAYAALKTLPEFSEAVDA